MGLITGLCRAYTDYIVPVSEAVLAATGVAKGSDRELPVAAVKNLVARFDGDFMPGGPVANSIAVAASLGSKTVFIGKVAADSGGAIFRDAFQKQAVVFKNPDHPDKDRASGTCVIFVTPDGERSIVYTRGVVDEIDATDIAICEAELRHTSIFLAGFPLRQSAANAAFLKAAQYLPASALTATILQSIAGMEKEALKDVSTLILSRADVIFGNEAEYRDFTAGLGVSSIENLALDFPDKIFCRTLGEKGASVIRGRDMFPIPAAAARAIDATGAGDAFAGGFLHALNQGKGPEEAGGVGASCAARIISQKGARPAPGPGAIT